MRKPKRPSKPNGVARSDNQQSRGTDREAIEWLDPDAILLDKNNPRIRPLLLADGLANPTQEQIAAAIVKSREWRTGRGGFTMPFNDFLNAVAKDGRINEPPVVQRRRDGKPVVLHGNNRVLAAQKAKKQLPGMGFDLVRCRVLPADTPDAEIQTYMQIAHNPATKQADWHPAAHAHRLYQLANAEIGGIGTMTNRELQEEFAKGPKTIKDMVQAYGAMQRYMAETDDRRPLALWATFHEYYRNKGVAELYTSDDDFRDAVHRAMQEKKLNAEDVKILPKIKEDRAAWNEFTEGAGSAAAKLMVEGDVESENHFDRMRKLSRIIRDVSNGPSVNGIKRNPAQKKIVTDLVEAVRTLLEKADMGRLLKVPGVVNGSTIQLDEDLGAAECEQVPVYIRAATSAADGSDVLLRPSGTPAGDEHQDAIMTESHDAEEELTAKEAAEIIGCSHTQVCYLARHGKIRARVAKMPNGRPVAYLFKRADVENERNNLSSRPTRGRKRTW